MALQILEGFMDVRVGSDRGSIRFATGAVLALEGMSFGPTIARKALAHAAIVSNLASGIQIIPIPDIFRGESSLPRCKPVTIVPR